MFTHWCDEPYLPLETLDLVRLKKIQTSNIALMPMDQIQFYVHHSIFYQFVSVSYDCLNIHLLPVFFYQCKTEVTLNILFLRLTVKCCGGKWNSTNKLQVACYNQWYTCNITQWSCPTTSMPILHADFGGISLEIWGLFQQRS